MVRGGEFLVTDRSANGNAGGEVTLRLKRIGNHVPKLVGGSLVLGAPTFARGGAHTGDDAAAASIRCG